MVTTIWFPTETSSIATEDTTVIPPEISIQIQNLNNKTADTQKGLEAHITATRDI